MQNANLRRPDGPDTDSTELERGCFALASPPRLLPRLCPGSAQAGWSSVAEPLSGCIRLGRNNKDDCLNRMQPVPCALLPLRGPRLAWLAGLARQKCRYKRRHERRRRRRPHLGRRRQRHAARCRNAVWPGLAALGSGSPPRRLHARNPCEADS